MIKAQLGDVTADAPLSYHRAQHVVRGTGFAVVSKRRCEGTCEVGRWGRFPWRIWFSMLSTCCVLLMRSQVFHLPRASSPPVDILSGGRCKRHAKDKALKRETGIRAKASTVFEKINVSLTKFTPMYSCMDGRCSVFIDNVYTYLY